MSARIRLKRGSTTSWANSSKDNKLSYGQPGIEIRAGKAPRLKVGNVNQDTAWASIPYICPDPEIYQDSQIGTSNNPLSNGYFNALTATEVVNIGLSEISNYSTNLDGTYGQNPLCVSTDQGRYELIFGGGKIGGVQNPSNDNDAANKKYIDDIITSSASTTTPKIAGTAAIGSETTFARGDHVHPAQTTISGNAGTATKLATARTIQTNLASTSSASFDGSANITPGVTGTLSITHGGTGATTAADARKNLGLGEVATNNVVPIARGGTGATDRATALGVLSGGGTYSGDLNNAIDPGVYWVDLSSCSNGPSTSGYGWLEICKAAANSNSKIQRFTYYQDGDIVVRAYTNSQWYSWCRHYSISLPVSVANGGTGANSESGACSNLGAVKKSGDTMTGNLTISTSGNPYLCVNDPSTGESGYFQLYSKYMAMGYTFSKSIRVNSSGNIVIPSGAYGSTLPTAGSTGRIFFKKV